MYTLERRCIAIDVTPILPGAENGGAKLMTVELIRHLSRIAPNDDFILLTSENSHDELAMLDAANVRRLCVVHQQVISSSMSPASARMFRIREWLKARLSDRLITRLRNLREKAARYKKPGSLLRRINADLLFCPFTAPTFFEPAVPVVSVIYDLQYLTYPEFFDGGDRHQRDRNFREACRLSSRLVCISDYVRGTVMKGGGVPADCVVTAHIRIPHRLSQPTMQEQLTTLARLNLSQGDFLLYSANFWLHKNHSMLLTAYGKYRSLYPQSGLKLVFTGAPSERTNFYRRAVAEMGLSDWVVFAGFLPEGEMAALMASCRAVIFPSLYEGFGMPLLEAMAYGKAVLCSNTTSLPEVANGAALFFDPRKPDEILDAIVRLENEPGLVAQLVDSGHRRVAELGGPERMAAEYLKIFNEAMQGSDHLLDFLHGTYADGWAGDRISICYRPSPEERHLELDFMAPPWLPVPKIRIKMTADNSNESRTFIVNRGETINIRLDLEHRGGNFELQLMPSFQPAKFGMGEDMRQLSCMCHQCRIVSMSASINLLHVDGGTASC